MVLSLLGKRKYKVSDKITINIPTIREVRGVLRETEGSDEQEKKYWSCLDLFLANPTSMMVMLDKIGIDFTQIKDYELFLILFKAKKDDFADQNVNRLFFDNINLFDFEIFVDKKTEKFVLYNEKEDIKIDEQMYNKLSYIFCQINFHKKEVRKMGNETMRKYAIERQEVKMKRLARMPYVSPFDRYLVALVNNCNFKYNYEQAQDLTVYDFNISLRQIIKKYQIDNLNRGIYSGTISSDGIQEKDLDWLSMDFLPKVNRNNSNQNINVPETKNVSTQKTKIS